MNKFDVIPQTFTLSPASRLDRGPARRLIVLVPKSEADTANAARKIWELANALGGRVQFLGLGKDTASESSLRRQMVTLSAMVEDTNVFVESKIESGRNWLDVVKSNWREGDVIACFSEQQTGFTRRPLSQILESNLDATVYVISEPYQEERPRLNWFSPTMAWTGSIGIILGFFWLQMKLAQLPPDWAHNSFLYLSILVEVGLVWTWNSLF